MINQKCIKGQTFLLRIGLLIFTVTMLVQTSAAKGPPGSSPGFKRGHEAVETLAGRLPEVASRYGRSAEKLTQVFLHDNDLWLDPAENLLYLCSFGMSEAETLPEANGPAIPSGPFPLEQTFQLHSQVGASRVIYLDFDGHVTSGTIWNSNFNGGSDIISEPYNFEDSPGSFSDAELNRIQNIWARVAEDFAFYNIDVTTEEPGPEALRRSGPGDEYYGIRVVISPSSGWYGSAGGVAYVGSFDWNSDTPTFVFSDRLGNGNEKYVTVAVSHETGHTLGLTHDGKTDGTEYYAGHGSWAPIMGVGYYKPITQWCRGEYAGANNTQDDLSVMLNNGATYRQDDHGGWIDSATWLNGETLTASGMIERTADTDVFGFQTEAGSVFIAADPAALDPNLDILIQILDENGNIINEKDPYYVLPASLNLYLAAGTYYILIDGVGTGDPDSGYSDYASLGQYFIFATLPAGQTPPAVPSDLSAFPVSSTRISLNWIDNSSNENGFSIERSAITPDNWIAIAAVAGNITDFTDTGLSMETTYYYRVSAHNSAGTSGYSNNAGATTLGLPPVPPTGLSASALSPSSIILHWTDNSDNETGFSIERSPDGSSGWQEIANVSDNTDSYTDIGLVPGTVYYYRVAAYNANGISGCTNTADAATNEIAPQSPTDLSGSAASFTQIDLTWQDNSNNEAGFKIERSYEGDIWTEIANLPKDRTSYSDPTVSSGTTYYYRICAFNSAGTGYSNTITVSTAAPPPYRDFTAVQEAAIDGTVSGSLADTRADDSTLETITERTTGGPPHKRYSYLEHKWLIPVQPGTGVTLFANVWAQRISAEETFVFSYSMDDTNYAEMFSVSSEIDNDGYYAYQLPENLSGTVYVKVLDTLRKEGSYDKSSLYLDHLFIRIGSNSEPESPPLAPADLTVAGFTFDAITLDWTDNSDNELGFYIERSYNGISSWELIGTTGFNTEIFTDTGLGSGKTFFYQVQAFNSTGVSDYSDIVSASTTEAGTVHVGGLDAFAANNRNRWDAHVTITVHDQNNAPASNALVDGSWGTGGSSTCMTGQDGRCTLSNTRLKTSVDSVTFKINSISGPGHIYYPAGNAADSIEITRP